jgi:hypothetical protein
MNLGLGDAQKFYLGNQEVSKIFLQNTEVFSSVITETDPFINNVSLLMHMDGTNGSQTFTDSSTNNFTLTAFGNTRIDTSVKKFGTGAAYFDGSGDYISRPLDLAFEFPDDFTIECWFYTTNQGNQGLFNTIPFNSSIFTTRSIILNLNNVNGYSFGISTIASTGTSAAFSLNVWNHVALVRENGNINLYSNGIKIATQTFTSSLSTGGLHIGTAITDQTLLFDTRVAPFSGYIDEFRITKGVARYTSNFIPQTAPFANL